MLTRSQIHPSGPNSEVSSRSGHIAAAAKRVWVAPVALGFGALGCATGGDGDGGGCKFDTFVGYRTRPRRRSFQLIRVPRRHCKKGLGHPRGVGLRGVGSPHGGRRRRGRLKFSHGPRCPPGTPGPEYGADPRTSPSPLPAPAPPEGGGEVTFGFPGPHHGGRGGHGGSRANPGGCPRRRRGRRGVGSEVRKTRPARAYYLTIFTLGHFLSQKCIPGSAAAR